MYTFLYLLEVLSEKLLSTGTCCKCMSTVYARTEDLYQSDLKSVQEAKSFPSSCFSANRRGIKLLDRDSKLDISHSQVDCSNRSSCPRLVFVWSDSFSLGLLYKMAAI